MFDWYGLIQTVVTAVLSGSLVGFVTLRATRKKANEEAKQTEVETQSQKIDLGDKYIAQVKELSDMQREMMQQQREQWERDRAANDAHWKEREQKIDKLVEDVTDIKNFLNGDFKQFQMNAHHLEGTTDTGNGHRRS